MRPKRIRCHCCHRLMAFEPYKKGDAIRRQPPNAATCLDCEPGVRDPVWMRPLGWKRRSGSSRCARRGCKNASAIDKLASIARRA